MADTFYDKVLPALTGFGVAASLALTGVSLPILISQGRDIQKLQDQMDTLKGDVETVKNVVNRLDKRMEEVSTDPTRYLSKVIGVPEISVSKNTGVVVNGQEFVFPKDDRGKAELEKAGYREKEITPTVSGYVKDGTNLHIEMLPGQSK